MENFSIINSIKLVIWDLDETFWQGTLSEEGIQVINENVEIIRMFGGACAQVIYATCAQG